MAPAPEHRHLDKKRFEAFIDAIFAVIITFLVLEFKIPHFESATTAQLQAELVDMIPLFICYCISFFTIVVIWLDHHNLFKLVEYVDRRYAIINFCFIFSVSALPFTTGFAGENFHNPFAVLTFLVSLLVMNIFFTAVFLYPIRNKMVDTEKMNQYNNNRYVALVGLGLEVLSIPLVFVNIYLAIGISISVLFMHLFKKI